MTIATQNMLWRQLHSAVAACESSRFSDADLVSRFAAARDEAAFAALVRRHGPMVLGLARRMAISRTDADDIFQAAFLVLARKASGLRAGASVGSWLYGVTLRLAKKARWAAARRSAHEAAAVGVAPARVADPAMELSLREVQEILDEELIRLPVKFRAPLLLCCLEGFAREEAARQLGWSPGLVKSRLEQARQLLHQRLVRRGLTLSAALAAGLVPTSSTGAVPADLVRQTVRAAASPVGAASSAAVALARSDSRWFVLTARGAVLLAAGLGIVASLMVAPQAAPTNESAQTNGAREVDDPGDPSPVPASIAGSVVDDSGKPVAGATVTALDMRETRPATSSADGTFRLTVLPVTAEWRSTNVFVRAPDGRLGFATIFEISGEPYRIVVRPPRVCTVRVEDRQHKAVAGAEVYLLAPQKAIDSARTGDDGKCTVRLPTDAKYWSLFGRKSDVGCDYMTARTSAAYDAPTVPPPDMATLTLDGARRVRVRTTDSAGKPLPGMRVGPWCLNKGGAPIFLDQNFWPTTDRDGSATLDWLPARQSAGLQLLAGSDDYCSVERFAAVPDDKTTDPVTIALYKLQTVSGKITRADGQPAAGARVDIHGQGSAKAMSFIQAVRTAADGRFKAMVFPEQIYVIAATDGTMAAPYRAGIRIRAGESVKGIDFVLRQATTLCGRVTRGRNFVPYAGTRIEVLIDDGSMPKDDRHAHHNKGKEDGTYHLYFVTRADKDGRFEFHLGPGDYWLSGPVHTELIKVSIPQDAGPAVIVRDLYAPVPN
jgi:RNA polymerase sigma factor (sigma-70 family)